MQGGVPDDDDMMDQKCLALAPTGCGGGGNLNADLTRAGTTQLKTLNPNEYWLGCTCPTYRSRAGRTPMFTAKARVRWIGASRGRHSANRSKIDSRSASFFGTPSGGGGLLGLRGEFPNTRSLSCVRRIVSHPNNNAGPSMARKNWFLLLLRTVLLADGEDITIFNCALGLHLKSSPRDIIFNAWPNNYVP